MTKMFDPTGGKGGTPEISEDDIFGAFDAIDNENGTGAGSKTPTQKGLPGITADDIDSAFGNFLDDPAPPPKNAPVTPKPLPKAQQETKSPNTVQQLTRLVVDISKTVDAASKFLPDHESWKKAKAAIDGIKRTGKATRTSLDLLPNELNVIAKTLEEAADKILKFEENGHINEEEAPEDPKAKADPETEKVRNLVTKMHGYRQEQTHKTSSHLRELHPKTIFEQFKQAKPPAMPPANELYFFAIKTLGIKAPSQHAYQLTYAARAQATQLSKIVKSMTPKGP